MHQKFFDKKITIRNFLIYNTFSSPKYSSSCNVHLCAHFLSSRLNVSDNTWDCPVIITGTYSGGFLRAPQTPKLICRMQQKTILANILVQKWLQHIEQQETYTHWQLKTGINFKDQYTLIEQSAIALYITFIVQINNSL